jgi:hypothetical protein
VQKERTHTEVTEGSQLRKLREADEAAAQLHAALHGREQRHGLVLETLTALRQTLAEREGRIASLARRATRAASHRRIALT